MKLVEIENLSVDYERILALKGINFSVNKGDFLGIIGPNGAGKTTLFGCMLGLIQKYSGEIRFFGKNIRKTKDHLSKIGYVPQKPVFEKNFPATVREVVQMGLRRKSQSSDQVEKTLQQVWIHELGHRRIGDLSGGQLQRVFIAKALVSNPQILILDEPVTGIDSQSKQLFYEILREQNKKGITIIWSSHDLDAVSKLANKVACLNMTLFFHGISDEFFSNEDLLKQYSESSMQMHMHKH